MTFKYDVNAWCCYLCAYLFSYGIAQCNDGITGAAMFGIIALTFVRLFTPRNSESKTKDRVEEFRWYLLEQKWRWQRLGKKTVSIDMETVQNLIDLLKEVENESN